MSAGKGRYKLRRGSEYRYEPTIIGRSRFSSLPCNNSVLELHSNAEHAYLQGLLKLERQR